MEQRIKLNSTPINGPYLIETSKKVDSRGDFTRLFCDTELSQVFSKINIKQINCSRNSHKGTIRGLHMQEQPFLEDKIVYCLHGKIWDVMVDLRPESDTFLLHTAVVLDSSSLNGCLVPRGFAHGFQTLVDDCQVLYIHNNTYQPRAQKGFNPFDPKIGIPWPLKATEVSHNDQNHPLL